MNKNIVSISLDENYQWKSTNDFRQALALNLCMSLQSIGQNRNILKNSPGLKSKSPSRYLKNNSCKMRNELGIKQSPCWKHLMSSALKGLGSTLSFRK